MPRHHPLTHALIRSVDFLRRHRWSVPLSVLSAGCFVQLAREVTKRELDPFDAAASALITRGRGEWDGIMLALTRLGTFRSLLVLTLFTVAALLLVRRRREAWFLLFSTGGTMLLNITLKLYFQRLRPEGFLYLIPSPTSFSFPSGHAMGSMGVLASMVVVVHALGWRRMYRVATIVISTLLILGIAVSRVYFGVHFASDVIGGQLAGAAWVSAATGWFYPYLLRGEHAEKTPAIAGGDAES